MDKAKHALYEFQEMNQLAQGDSLVHQRHPLVKLLVTIAYIVIIASFDHYALSAMMVMVLYPVILFALTGISFRACLHKIWILLILVCAVGIFNPLLDQKIVTSIGNVMISGGVLSMLTLMLKGVLCVLASFLLVATTPIDSLCAAFRKLHVPAILVTMLLLTYRYITVMLEEISVMLDAYHLRAPQQKGIHVSAWGSFLGQLLLRSMDRAEDIYASMTLRGFQGEFIYADEKKLETWDVVYMLILVAFFFAARMVNITVLLGNLLA